MRYKEKPMEVISVRNVGKSFGGIPVLRDISLSVSTGEVVSIIGSSGSGKSTLLRCICQLETIDSGAISICGEDMASTDSGSGLVSYADKATLKHIRSHIGLVFQNFNLFPHFSVLRNITEAQEVVLKLPHGQAVETARTLLAKMGLTEKENAYPCELSGGQQQRVSIARALALKPEVLCFDEPTSALDPELTGEILKVIKDLAAEDMTMVVVTHEMAFAKDISDRVIFMDDGIIVEQGSPDSVISHPTHERTRQFLTRFME
ncbi:amino acid ABC transporter ATP-binding protein, PAAT family [Parasphaerochaeta coccoides DSM 17374]|uniref:Amino acid ABC transporter ATP-binding protein, PAAT family n=2 Tax=Parasphaerochaeta TaxID=3062336 RepID=F4GH70_PARC1|nr:amino acid ABC transporter ATP-binding protein, PAAT family [Parasphaerochaeta coccoides DSM 17374]